MDEIKRTTWKCDKLIRYNGAYVSVIRFWGSKAGAWHKMGTGPWRHGAEETHDIWQYVRPEQEDESRSTMSDNAVKALPAILQLARDIDEFQETYRTIDMKLAWSGNPGGWFASFRVHQYDLIVKRVKEIVPRQVMAELARYPRNSAWRMLQWFNRMPLEDALRLSRQIPFLAYALAHVQAVLPTTQPMRKARSLLAKAPIEILAAFGLSTKPAFQRVIARIEANDCTPSLLSQLVKDLRKPSARKFVESLDQRFSANPTESDLAIFLSDYAKGIPFEFLRDLKDWAELNQQSFKDASLLQRSNWSIASKLCSRMDKKFERDFKTVESMLTGFDRVCNEYRAYARALIMKRKNREAMKIFPPFHQAYPESMTQVRDSYSIEIENVVCRDSYTDSQDDKLSTGKEYLFRVDVHPPLLCMLFKDDQEENGGWHGYVSRFGQKESGSGRFDAQARRLLGEWIRKLNAT